MRVPIESALTGVAPAVLSGTRQEGGVVEHHGKQGRVLLRQVRDCYYSHLAGEASEAQRTC